MISTQRCAFALVSLFIFSLVIPLGTPPAFAQFNFPSFNSALPACSTAPASGICVNGSAQHSGSVLRLTPNTGGQAGSAWFVTPQSVTQGFTTTFQFRISNTSAPPADGFAFVIQNSGLTALGANGGGIGYGTNPDSPNQAGIFDSLAVEFDTFQNTGDPNGNHVAIQNCGTGQNSSDETALFGEDQACNLGTDSELPITLADGNVHTVVINYDANSSQCESGRLSIYLDGNMPILTSCFDLAARLGLEGGTAFVGFTGATGADVEDNDILNWSFTPHSGKTEDVILTFNPGTNVSQTATFDCPSHTSPCTDPEAHSLKLTASKVTQTFSLIISATQVTGTGSCASGDPNNPAFDCRFVNHFGTPGISPPAVTVPLCDPYDSGKCVYYRVENPPATSNYQGPIYWYIAWNDDTFVTSGACAAVTVPTTYQCNNRQMADDPSSPPHADANQFTQYITTYFNPNPNQVGIDPGLGGGTKNFNDVAVVFPQTVPNTNFVLILPQPNSKVERTDPLPIVFVLLQGSKVVTNANKAPNTIGVAVLDSNGVRQPIAAPGSPPPTFGFFFGLYFTGVDTSQLAPGSYRLLIDSNLFGQQTIPFTVVPED
jgi:Legume lectin domain